MLRSIIRTERKLQLLPGVRTFGNVHTRSPTPRVGAKYFYSEAKLNVSSRLSYRSFASIPTDRDDAKKTEDERAKAIAKEGSDASISSSSSSSSRDSIYRLIEMSRREWKLIGMSAATLGVTSSITLLLPFASGQVIDYTVNSGSAADGGLSPMLLASGLFGLSAVAGGGVYLRSLWLARAGNRIVARLKQQFYGSILKQETAFLDQQTTGDLLSRLSADAQLVQSALTYQAVAGLRGFVMSTGAAGMLLYTSPTLAVISCCTLPPVFILTRQVGRKLQEQQVIVQQLQGEATSLAEQSLASLSTVKQFVAEDYETTRYQNAIAKAHSKAVETAHMQAQLEAAAHISGNAAILGVLGYGGSLVLEGSISAGDLTGFVMYSLLLAGNLSGLTSVYSEMVRAVAASDRVFSILDREPQIRPHPTNATGTTRAIPLLLDPTEDPLLPITYQHKPNPNHRTTPDGSQLLLSAPVSIEIQGLNFSYPSRNDVKVLKNFSLTVAPGEVVALVGGSGSGKSTIASLLTRLYDPENKSAIRIDGRPVSDYDPSELRKMIGIVSQEPMLFRGSIRDNIAYGEWDNISEAEIVDAARLAHVLDFANKFPDGLDTMVGPRGMQLSGGQRQRIALARVLAKKSPIIILDEATSALDAQSEHLVQKAMNSIVNDSGRTIISIAHRLSTIRHASRVVVVEDGSVVQTGTFDELTTAEGPFRQLMKTQLVGDTSI
jgi:ATP-binding cassette subfamily B (MDR/TAP) protein 10